MATTDVHSTRGELALPDTQQQRLPAQAGRRPSPLGDHLNVGSKERIASGAAGSALALLGLARRDLPGLLIAGLGGALIYRGATGHCHLYETVGLDTASRQEKERQAHRGIHVTQSSLIDRTAEELYTWWRDFANLPRIMTHLESVRVLDDRRSHWVATAPRLAGGRVEWDAEITADEPNARIQWRSLPGSDVEHRGEVRFAAALGDRGTVVSVVLDYLPPAGQVGRWAAKLFGEEPEQQIRDDLRNFKRLMEAGEIVTTSGQPHGACGVRG